MFHFKDRYCIKIFHSYFIKKASLSVFVRLLKFGCVAIYFIEKFISLEFIIFTNTYKMFHLRHHLNREDRFFLQLFFFCARPVSILRGKIPNLS